MAALPQVYIKISMLGWILPGWKDHPDRISLLKELVCEVVDLFTPSRCMVALNWWKSGPISDADGLSQVGPDAVEFLQFMSSFLEKYSEEDRQRLFCGSAKEFYKL